MVSQSPLEVGQFVRVLYETHENIHDTTGNYVTSFTSSCEGLISSVLFDKNIEVSYIEEDKPVSRWFCKDDVINIEIL